MVIVFSHTGILLVKNLALLYYDKSLNSGPRIGDELIERGFPKRLMWPALRRLCRWDEHRAASLHPSVAPGYAERILQSVDCNKDFDRRCRTHSTM